MSRYRLWVRALHWGQLLLLVPTWLVVGVALGVGAVIYEDAVLMEKAALVIDPDFATMPLTAKREKPVVDPDFANIPIVRPQQREAETPALEAPRDLSFAEREKRIESRAAWVRRAGMLGLALAWLTAFLSLWWWFGAKAKPRGSQ
jgi:hypothetical protein